MAILTENREVILSTHLLGLSFPHKTQTFKDWKCAYPSVLCDIKTDSTVVVNDTKKAEIPKTCSCILDISVKKFINKTCVYPLNTQYVTFLLHNSL